MRAWRGCAALLAAGMGCAAPSDPTAADSSSSGDGPPTTTGEDPTVQPTVGSTVDPGTTSADSSTTTIDASTTTDTGVLDTTESGEDATTTEGTTGEIQDCSTFEQDCPDGFKCMPYDDTGGFIWNATGCFPIADEPAALGGACESNGASGVDTCDEGLMCWGEPGECVAMCEGTPNMPECGEQTSCTISNDGAVAVCLPACDPLLDDCGDGAACYAVGAGTFVCAPEGASGQGEGCQFVNSCASGFLCAAAQVVADCNAQACCTAFCDLADPLDDCAGTGDGMSCVAFFGDGMAPPGYESLGVCILL
jgi:hypothetical protein